MSKRIASPGAASSSKRSTTERYDQLLSLGKNSYVTQSGIRHLLKQIEQDGLPEHYSRGSLYRARKAFCNEEQGRFGPVVESEMLPLIGGEDV